MPAGHSLKILLAACLLVAVLASEVAKANELEPPKGPPEQIEPSKPFDLGEAVKSRLRHLAYNLVVSSMPGYSDEERRQRLRALKQSEDLEAARADGPSGKKSAGGQLARSNKPVHERIKFVGDSEASWHLVSGW